jgi:hypothetical protein
MKTGMLFAFTLLIVSCSTVRVNYDYDKETAFNNYTTYNYYPEMVTGLSDLDNKRLLTAIDQNMASKGILLSEEPDFLINIQSRSSQMPRNNSVGVGLGGGGGGIGGGISMGIPVGQPGLQLELQFDFVDSQKQALFWQGISQGPFKESATPVAREQKLKEIVDKVFSKFPPNTKK